MQYVVMRATFSFLRQYSHTQNPSCLPLNDAMALNSHWPLLHFLTTTTPRPTSTELLDAATDSNVKRLLVHPVYIGEYVPNIPHVQFSIGFRYHSGKIFRAPSQNFLLIQESLWPGGLQRQNAISLEPQYRTFEVCPKFVRVLPSSLSTPRTFTSNKVSAFEIFVCHVSSVAYVFS